MLSLRQNAHKPVNYHRMCFLVSCLKRLKGSQEWLNRQQKLDPYIEKARIYNYRCRSAFKLLEMDEMSNLMSPGQSVIDLGAAPGSWTQVAVDKTNADGANPTKPKGFVLAVDKLPIMPITGATLMSNMDFSKVDAQSKVVSALGGRKVDVVLSDMVPDPSGVRGVDKDRLLGLNYMALRFAALVSKVNGSLLFKIWECKEIPVLIMDLERFYESIEVMRPRASRLESAEKFILAQGYKGVQRPLARGQWS